MILTIIQARMENTRLPGKSMMNLAGKPVIQHVIERAEKLNTDEVVIATTTEPDDLVFEKFGIRCHHFSNPDDVLNRFKKLAIEYKPDYIVRLTADNPLFCWKWANIMINRVVDSGLDYGEVMGHGIRSEIISTSALMSVWGSTDEKEHVTIKYAGPVHSSNKGAKPGCVFYNPYPPVNLSIDTQEDYEKISSIYNALYREWPIPTKDAIEWLSM